MPLLNPPDVLPEPMRLITRCLLSLKKPVPQDELIRLVAPTGLTEALSSPTWAGEPEATARAGQIIVDKSLAEMRKAGLVQVEAGKTALISLTESVTEVFPNQRAVNAEAFSSFLREVVLSGGQDQHSAPEPEKSTGADLGTALALMLWIDDPLQPLDGFEADSTRTLRSIQNRDLGEDRSNWVLANNEQYQPLIAWSVYLGFAVLAGGSRLMVDPARALRPALAKILDGEQSIGFALERLGEILPSTDRGVWGRSIASKLGLDPTTSVSPGVALGLFRLQHSGAVVLSRKSDTAESLDFPAAPGVGRSYSHIAPGKSL